MEGKALQQMDALSGEKGLNRVRSLGGGGVGFGKTGEGLGGAIRGG